MPIKKAKYKIWDRINTYDWPWEIIAKKYLAWEWREYEIELFDPCTTIMEEDIK